MGASSARQLITPDMDDFSSRFTFQRSKADINFHIENLTSKQYATKTILCDTPEEQSQFFAMIQKFSQLKHQNIISVEKIYSLQSRSCGTTASKYMILFPYAFRNIKDERDERVVLQQGFTEPEIWSIILSVCRALSFLQEKGIPFSPITAQQILIDKEGLIQIDANHLAQNNFIEDNYVSRTKNLRYLPPESKNLKLSYMNIREIQRYNIYSIGIIALQCLEMRDLVEIESLPGQQKQVVQLLINRSTFVSSQLKQIIRRLTESPQYRPTYREIIDFIENEQTASSFLYHQNQIATAKKQSFVDYNYLNFDGFGGRPSSNIRLNMPRSQTIPNSGYTIPSFSYNNINKEITGNQIKQNISPSQPAIIDKHFHPNTNLNSGLPQPIQLFPTNPSLPVSYLTNNPIEISHPQFIQPPLKLSNYHYPAMQEININMPHINNLNFPQQIFPSQTKTMRPFVLESPSIIKHAQSNISHVDSNLKLRGTGVADDIRLISPKPSLLVRDSYPNSVRQVKPCFSKTGSIEGFNKIYNDNPQKCYEKIDYRNLNNVGGAWLYFQGNFKDGLRFGPGVLYMSNGQMFEGNFINDTAEGRGKYSTLDWKSIEGIWQNGLLISTL